MHMSYNILPHNFTWEPGVLIAQSAHSNSLTTSSPHILDTAVRGDVNKSAMHVACFEYKDLQGRPGSDLQNFRYHYLHLLPWHLIWYQ